MKKTILSAIILLSVLVGQVVTTNIGDFTNISPGTNALTIYNRPDFTGVSVATTTNGSLLSLVYPWSFFYYGKVLSGSLSNSTGWMYYDLVSTNKVPYLGSIANGGGNLLSAPSSSTRLEAGTASVKLIVGTLVNILTNLYTWAYVKVNSGDYSNSNGYIPMQNINTNSGLTNAPITGYRVALRTVPRPLWYGTRLGTSSYLSNTLSFSNISNSTSWYYVSRSDFTNGYISNYLVTYIIYTNFVTNITTN